VLSSATTDDWQLVRWQAAPAAERVIADLRTPGEQLLLLP
jgi:hypothetical protein